MARSKTKQLPSICLDEHVHPNVADSFRTSYRTIEVAQTNKFKARDERDFITELFQENTIFVTSDREFVDEAVDKNLKHAGIIFIPNSMDLD